MQDGIGLGHALECVLGVVGHAHVGAQITRAGSWRSRPARIFMRVDLPAPLGPTERHMLAAVELEVDIAVDVLFAVGLGDALEPHDHVARSAAGRGT